MLGPCTLSPTDKSRSQAYSVLGLRAGDPVGAAVVVTRGALQSLVGLGHAKTGKGAVRAAADSLGRTASKQCRLLA